MLAQSQRKQPVLERGRFSILLAVTLTGATFFRFVELPTFSWSVRRILGSPLGFTLGGNWLLPFMMIGLVASGTFSLLRSHPYPETRERAVGFSLIAPALGALLTSLLLIRAVTWPIWLGSLVLGGVLTGGLVHLTCRVVSLQQQGYAGARTLLNLAGYLLGFVLFGIAMRTPERALVTGPIIMSLSGLLALDLLSASGVSTRSVLLFSGIIALLEGELVWVLGYWPISAWTAAVLLTLGLYVGIGVSYQHLLGKLTWHILVEFATLSLIVFILTLALKP